MGLDAELLKILACPRCKGVLEEREEGLDCQACGLRYPIDDGIPILLEEDATPLAGD